MTTARIIVGVDGSTGARTALEWAVDECRLRSCTLLVVYARQAHPDAAGPVGLGYDEVAERLLTRHAAAASARQPGVAVTTLLSGGPPASTLIDLSADAELVVVGTRGNSAFTSTMLGSISTRTAAHAHCAVAVVPQRLATRTDENERPVVVGVFAGHAGRLGFEFARDEARVRGARLRSVSAEPDAEPAENLLRAAEAAQLLVLGCLHSEDRWSSRLGAVPTAILHRATCPVIVVSELPQMSMTANEWRTP
ncbi:MAG: hypothetical protein DLM58_04875 [Pseudonocardiales bacterium]|nr:MAG: hypothetical protein DLM58_04875 [Pseudonocardiales bacterium]